MGYTSDGSGSIAYSLHTGANLVSFPFVGEHSASTVDKIDVMFDRKITGIIGEGVAADSGSNGWQGSLSTIDPKSGYWVKSSGTATATITASLVSSDGIDIHQHANLQSSPYPINVALADGLKPNTVGKIFGIIGEGVAADDSDGDGVWAGSLTHFQPGGGYWLKANVAVEDIFTPTGSGPEFSGYGTGSSYYACHTYPCTGAVSECSGFSCDIIGSSTFPTIVFPERHEFGYWGTMYPSWHFMTGSFRGTSSFQDKDGNAISGNLHIGFFPPEGTASYALGAFFGPDHSYHNESDPVCGTPWYTDGDWHTISLNWHEAGLYPNHPLYSDTTEGAYHPDNPDNVQLMPSIGSVGLTCKIYDPVRNKIFSASMHKWDGTEVTDFGFGDSAYSMKSHILGPEETETSTAKHWKYFKLKH